MKVLFDHNVPRKLRKYLKVHLVTTAAQMGWAELANGELIQRAELSGFDVFVTGDQGIRYQQNHALRRIPIILLSSTYWPQVEAKVDAILNAIAAAEPRSFTVVTIEPKD